jgi:two-component system sensor histidine kinase KdpD
MVENLLDLSRMQAGVLGPTADWLDPRELVEAAADRCPAGPAGRLQLDLPHDIPLIRADAAQLDRVLVNLIENALKFSPPDAPVEVVLDAPPGAVRVAVLDRGPGVDPAEAAAIFEPFVRGSADRRVIGSGLGLAIARGLAEANAGRLEVAARDGGGSVFTLTVPRDGPAG